MKVIGITGASGSGKTTVCNILSIRDDVKIIDADKIARELTFSESDYLKEVKKCFHDREIIEEDGQLSRKKLSQIIYSSEEDLEKLNQITFKYVVPKIIDEINNVPDDVKIVIVDAPLLFEAGIDKYCDYTITFDVPEVLKIDRICKRDNISEETAKARLNIQNENEYYIKKSDFVIINDENTNLEDLKKKIEEIIKKVI